MSESAKTVTFIAVACLLAGAAYITRPEVQSVDPPELVGQELFSDFDDPAKATRMEIVRYEEELGEIHQFEVAKDRRTGLWQIPSHDDYPADAEEQMRDAALSLVGLKVLGLVTEDASEHELFGVLEPSRDETRMGDEGVGILISFSDETGQDLAELVIGKQVKGADSQRFVRVPGQDMVYAVEIDPTRLSTEFEDWIESDLLQLNAFDIEGLGMKDYSVVETTRGPTLQLRSAADVTWNATDSKWELQELLSYRGRVGTPTELLATEELNQERLNEAKTALDDLKIEDVRRKPAGLGADLKGDAEFMENRENRQDLFNQGFYPNENDDGSYELLAANGEFHAVMKEGYEYVLRFGGVAGTGDDDSTGLNRYLLVTARVLEDHFPMPELEPLPEGASSADTPGNAEGEETADTADAPDSDADAEATEDEAAGADTTDEASKDEASADETSADETSADEASADAEGDQSNPESSAKEDEERRIAAETERITNENQRKLDEWREKKETAETKVRELNTRFADWYYVIAEEEYRKIHLTRSDIIKESETAAEEGFGLDAFRQLEESGVEEDKSE